MKGKDVLEEAFAYLEKVPTGKAQVRSDDAKSSFRKAGRSGPVAANVKIWAEMHGFTVTGDRPSLEVSNIFYFRVKS